MVWGRLSQAMRNAPIPYPLLLFPVFAVVWLAMSGCGLAQSAPPADGILDDTRALTAESHRKLAVELSHFRQDLQCDAWIKASSFMATGSTIRREAQTTRRAWSATRPAVLMAYDRSSNSSAVSFAPVLWERYPAAELVEIMQEIRRIISDPKLSLDERLVHATYAWIDRLRRMESVRLRQSLWIQRREKSFAIAVPVILAIGAVIAAFFGYLSRQRTARAAMRFLFPEIHVGMRFGAAYGGGVTAEVKTNVSSQ